MSDPAIFHITEPEVWGDATRTGVFIGSTRGRTVEQVGYVHCSFASQVEPVANCVYGDWDGELLLLEIDPDQVRSEMRVENLIGGDEGFPHVYGELPVAAVTGVHLMAREQSGWTVPADLYGRRY